MAFMSNFIRCNSLFLLFPSFSSRVDRREREFLSSYSFLPVSRLVGQVRKYNIRLLPVIFSLSRSFLLLDSQCMSVCKVLFERLMAVYKRRKERWGILAVAMMFDGTRSRMLIENNGVKIAPNDPLAERRALIIGTFAWIKRRDPLTTFETPIGKQKSDFPHRWRNDRTSRWRILPIACHCLKIHSLTPSKFPFVASIVRRQKNVIVNPVPVNVRFGSLQGPCRLDQPTICSGYFTGPVFLSEFCVCA